MKIYLASTSPRRKDLLAQLGVTFIGLWPDENEAAQAEAVEAGLPHERPTQYVQRVAQAKLVLALDRFKQRAALHDLQPLPILCADTTVCIGQTILGKPKDAADALYMLKSLSGRSHRVLTAVAVATPKPAGAFGITTALSVSRVLFARLSAEQMAWYINTQEPFGKAGAYAYQGLAAQFIRKVEGSASGIIGLPLYETARLLKL
jgi:septum formation protein